MSNGSPNPQAGPFFPLPFQGGPEPGGPYKIQSEHIESYDPWPDNAPLNYHPAPDQQEAQGHSTNDTPESRYNPPFQFNLPAVPPTRPPGLAPENPDKAPAPIPRARQVAHFSQSRIPKYTNRATRFAANVDSENPSVIKNGPRVANAKRKL